MLLSAVAVLSLLWAVQGEREGVARACHLRRSRALAGALSLASPCPGGPSHRPSCCNPVAGDLAWQMPRSPPDELLHLLPLGQH